MCVWWGGTLTCMRKHKIRVEKKSARLPGHLSLFALYMGGDDFLTFVQQSTDKGMFRAPTTRHIPILSAKKPIMPTL